MSVIVFAGAAQLAAIQLLSVGATATVIVLTALIVNLRFVMYSAALAPHFARLPAPWKWMLAYLITDHAFAVFITHCNDTPNARHKHWYFFGAALGFWLTWQATTLVGIVLGAQVPPGWSLDFAIPLTFLVLVVPTITDRPSLAAAITAGSIAIVGATWPYNTGLISAALLGVAVGRLLEARQG
jgi:4-azaleucine resistance transporter AzlC